MKNKLHPMEYRKEIILRRPSRDPFGHRSVDIHTFPYYIDMNSTNLFQRSVTQRPSSLDLTATPLVTDPLACVVALGLFQAYIRVDLTDRGTNVSIIFFKVTFGLS